MPDNDEIAAKWVCECGRELIDLYIAVGGALMVECPEHGLHEWGEVDA